jgi:cobyrinic acid a,c-diamide synthase
MIAAPSSGNGKTAVAVGLLAALRSRGLVTAGFKIGPDYLDAGYLGVAAGRPGRNLDPGLVGAARLPALFGHGAAGAEVSVIEATMGLYDGLSGYTDVPSSAQVAELLKAPVALVVDVAAMGQSVAAMVHGFRVYDELLWLGGVILNQVASDRHEQVLREALDDIGVPVLGALRRRELSGVALPSRADGLVPVVHRSTDVTRAIRRLAEVITGSVDLDRLLMLARSAPDLGTEAWSPAAAVGPWSPPAAAGPVSIGVGPWPSASALAPSSARQHSTGTGAWPIPAGPSSPAGPPSQAGPSSPAGPPAMTVAPWPSPVAAGPSSLAGGPLAGGSGVFATAPVPGSFRPMIGVTTGYGYPETAELLAAAGAEVVGVDPLRDETLPDGVRGLVIGGGLPEGYLDELSANGSLNLAVARLAAAGYPIVAEGAGLAWLCREYDGRPMCGVIDAAGRTGEHVVIGYRDATVRSVSPVLPLGTQIVGYKQHRGLVSPRAGAQPAWSWPGGAPEGFVSVGLHASYLCLHWAAAPEMAVRFVTAAAGGASTMRLAS